MKTNASTDLLDVDASPFAAEDYVQMACQLRRSAEMEISYPDGRRGGIIVNKGELWHAWDNLGAGDEAFLRMIGIARVLRIRSLASTDSTTRTINESCQKLLLKALIARDTANSTATDKTTPARSLAGIQTTPARSLAGEQTAPASDTELTRPDWSGLRSRDTSRESDTPVTAARSYTERPVEMTTAPAGTPRSIRTFLRQQSLVQRGAVALFGVILLGSVGKILASPAGGTSDTTADRLQADNPAKIGVSSPAAAGMLPASPVDIVRAQPGAVYNVGSLPTANWVPRTSVVTKVHNLTASGDLNNTSVGRHVTSATAQFAACYDAAASRSSNQSGLGDLSVVVNIDRNGSVVSAAARGGKLQGLNTCVATLAERLGTLLKATGGPSRLTWTVSYAAATPNVNTAPSEIH
jgi:hypothetical protein